MDRNLKASAAFVGTLFLASQPAIFAVTTDALGPEAAPAGALTNRALPSTAEPSTVISPGSAPIPFINPPAEPADAASMPLPPIQTSQDQHKDIAIPLDMSAATTGLLLDTTNPNRKPPKPPEPLTAVISNVEMTTGSQEIIFGKYHGLQVNVSNGTDRPLLFDGDSATLRLSGSTIKTITIRQTDLTVCPIPTAKDEVIAVARAAITVGAAPAIRDHKLQAGPILQRYGCDEKRREDEETRFGKRILWPGDSCSGIVFFQTDRSLRGGIIELPVQSLADMQDQTALKENSNIKGSATLTPIAAGQADAAALTPSTDAAKKRPPK